MSSPRPQTQRAETVHIDEHQRSAILTAQWLAEKDDASHPITAFNELEVLMCGEQSFLQIAKDIEAAQSTIDIICWGFDPGMELVRSGGTWPRGPTFGSLLMAAAARGVEVRLLVWYDKLASAKQNNLIGYTGDQRRGYWVDSPSTTAEDLVAVGIASPQAVFGARDSRNPEELRQDYCVTWWREVLAANKPDDDSASRIHVLKRSGNPQRIAASLQSEEDPPSRAAGDYGGLANEAFLLNKNGTHHQKTMLIDYADQGGKNAVGYVMGLNSVSDYWDSQEHLFDDPRRETDWGCKSETAQALRKLAPRQSVSRDPLHDYASRIRGPALQAVQQNFVKAWQRAGGKLGAQDANVLPPQLAQVKTPGSRIQVVRTQPEENNSRGQPDKTIKNVYWQAASFARDYIYIENQYFFYESWVRHLKATRANFMQWCQEAGRSREQCKTLHLMAVIPLPEDDGMVPRTYDMVKSLGEGKSMPKQHKAMENAIKQQEQQWQDWQNLPEDQRYDPVLAPPWDPVVNSAAKVQAPVKNPFTGELQGLGLKVLLARMVTHNQGKPLPQPELNYRQIYIHSKLMLIDDSFLTLGSANLNQRSMSVDSEINIACDDPHKAGPLRERVWRLLGGGYEKSAGGDGSPKAIAKAFKDWQKVMDRNLKNMPDNKPITGHLIPFNDERVVRFRHA